MHSIVLVVVHLGETWMYKVISTSMSSDCEREDVRKIEDMRIECVIMRRPIKDGSMDC